MAGSLDEDVLASPWAAGLTRPIGGQFWCKRFIKGVTDGIQDGTRWLEGPTLGFKVE